ncbi:hypothetical protein [Chitinophaga sp. CF418]|uniref:hypothetical protein n=1 Tax=Chitinophaga sp. CF418 TaxID=1855287 RepID=UPI00166002F5|nr:hypothetical protein [Chitinophaga sp. CF418]
MQQRLSGSLIGRWVCPCTNCHNQQRYEHVFDAHLAGTDQVLNTGDIVDCGA